MKQHIAIISEHASPLTQLGGVDSGGQNVYVAELGKALAKQHYNVDIFTRRDAPDQPAIVNWLPGVRVIHVKAGPEQFVEKERLLVHMKEFSQYMLSFIKKQKITYQLVHANFFMSALVASDIKKATGIPYVVTFHALGLVRKMHQKEMDKFPPERCDIEAFIVQDADQIIAECPQDKQDLVYYYNAPPERIAIVPCGFNPEEFHHIDQLTARKKLRLDPNEIILLQLGRMVPRKGVDNVIEALAGVSCRDKKIKLLVVGGETDDPDERFTPEIGRLKKIAADKKVDALVHFTGRKRRDDLKYYYAAADIFITTPWYEPFGITPLEAMACGTPVIGANVGGIKYSVVDGVTGLLVPPRDPASLSGAIEKLIHNPAVTRSMKKQAIRHVEKYFTWSMVACSVGHVYSNVISFQKKKTYQKPNFLLEHFDILKRAGSLLQPAMYTGLQVNR
jgi:D-inositol-3-phosphate glycosyltransferase